LEIPIKLHTFTPQEISIPSMGVVWIFSGTAHFKSYLVHLSSVCLRFD